VEPIIGKVDAGGTAATIGSIWCVSFTTGHFCKKIYYFPLKLLARFSATMSSFTGIYTALINQFPIYHLRRRSPTTQDLSDRSATRRC